MARELELKYSSLEGVVPSLHELEAALSGLGLTVAPGGTREQTDVYYDDQQGTLQRGALALRVRSSAGGRVAAVKGRGDAVAGLFERDELEAPMPQRAGAVSPWPAAVAERLAGVPGLGPLEKRLEIRTTREVFSLSRAGRPFAELLFDEVRCRPPAGADDALIEEAAFSEVEVEAAAGTSAAELRLVGAALQELLPLVAGSVSKLERAAALLAPFLADATDRP